MAFKPTAEKFQYSEMPEASASLGKVVQYVGTTTDTYTQGYFYQSDGSSWVRINTQPLSSSPIPCVLQVQSIVQPNYSEALCVHSCGNLIITSYGDTSIAGSCGISMDFCADYTLQASGEINTHSNCDINTVSDCGIYLCAGTVGITTYNYCIYGCNNAYLCISSSDPIRIGSDHNICLCCQSLYINGLPFNTDSSKPWIYMTNIYTEYSVIGGMLVTFGICSGSPELVNIIEPVPLSRMAAPVSGGQAYSAPVDQYIQSTAGFMCTACWLNPSTNPSLGFLGIVDSPTSTASYMPATYTVGAHNL